MYLSVGAICKNEYPYLEQWIAWNRVQGCTGHFIIDNGSTDGSYDLLLKLQEKGLVTVEQILGEPIQFRAYNHILKKHGKKTKYMAFLDLDEYLYSPKGPLPTVLKAYEKYAAVAARWVMFGSSGHLEYSPELVIERFTHRAKFADKHVKSIVQPARTIKVGKDPHHFILKGKAVDENFNVLQKEYALTHEHEPEKRTADIFRINHYHTKSKAESQLRWSTCPDPGTGVMRNFERNFPVYDLNEVTDLSAAIYADRVKEEIASWGI